MKNEDTKPSRRTLAAVAAAAGAITLAAGVTLGSLLGVVKMPAGAHSPPSNTSVPTPPAAPLTAAPEPEAQPAAAPEPEPVVDEAETELLAQGRGHERRERHHERRHERHDEAEESEDD